MKKLWGKIEKRFEGHILIGPITIYGFNAMHVAINIYTKHWGYICFHPIMRCFGHWWPWYFYISPNATPWAASFAIGPGIEAEDRRRLRGRKWKNVYRRMEKLWEEYYELEKDPNPYKAGFGEAIQLMYDRLMERR